ncbi:MAG: 5'-nucleotidase C-terminal domain-containing protein [Herpetosiphonaceae bacterium]|nr:5'-nucleotidase C-terminal domain-containing protein [Herpetosiphonaceae bacterium]
MLRRLMVGLFLLALVLPTVGSGAPAAAQDSVQTITLLETSDLHGNLIAWDYYANRSAEWSLSKVATLIRQERAIDPDLMLLDAGDTIQGTPLTYYYNVVDTSAPHPMAATMNALKYDMSALGNHEFNYGLPTLDRFRKEATFPILSANTRNTDGSEAFGGYIIKDVKGVKVGILAMTTPAIPNWEKPANIVGLRFDDPIETAKQYVPRMRAEGADVVVVLQHIGWERIPRDSAKPEAWLTDPDTWQDAGSLPGENTTIRLAKEVPGIDVVLSGHSHLDVPKAIINGVLISEPSYWGRVLGKITIQVENKDGTWQVVGKDSTTLKVTNVAADPEIVSIAQPYHDQTLAYINTPIGTSLGEFPGGPKARYTDGPLGDLINTVQSEAAAAAGYPVDVSLAAIFTDPGMIPSGEVTIRDAYSVYIYDNTLYVMEITGGILRRALEKNAEYFKQLDPAALPADPKGVITDNARDYNWDLYTGVDYTLDLTRPAGQRVTRLQIAGQDVTAEQPLRIAINNYRASGGGGFAMFREGKILWQSTNEVRDLMADYVRSKGTLDPAAINRANFTLVPDLYAHYYGGAQPAPAPTAVPPTAVPPAGGQPGSLPDTGVPATLPNTSAPASRLPGLGWLVGAAGMIGLSLLLVRRRATSR